MAAALVGRGFRVAAMEPTATTLGRLTPWADHVELVSGSVAEPDDVRRVVGETEPALIANLAFAQGAAIVEELEIMARGAWNVLEAARLNDCARVVLASSVRVYGPQYVHGHETVLDEESPCRPVVRYGHYKLLGEQLAADYNRKHGLEASALRIPMVYGPGVRQGAYGVCVPAVAAASGESAVLPYDPDASLCLAHVGDVAEALADLADPSRPAPAHAVYELGGHTISYRGMIDVAASLTDAPVDVRFEPDPRSHEHDFAYRLDNGRLRDELGLVHRPLSEGYRSIIDHIRNEVVG